MERKLHVSNRRVSSRVRPSRRRPGCIRLFVCPTTGGRMEISVSPRETVFGLKAALARKLRISASKITLIYKDKVLKDGCIQDHQILDESQITLLPNMESGLSVNRSERSIVQALENLTETQVNDFLSGRSPLMLAIRMGENMVFVQLQLSMLHPSAAAAAASAAPRSATPAPMTTSTTTAQQSTASQAPSTPPSTNTTPVVPNVRTPESTVAGAASPASPDVDMENAVDSTDSTGFHNNMTSRSHQGRDESQGQRSTPARMTLAPTPAVLAEATRCLSQRLHSRLHELNCGGPRAAGTSGCMSTHSQPQTAPTTNPENQLGSQYPAPQTSYPSSSPSSSSPTSLPSLSHSSSPPLTQASHHHHHHQLLQHQAAPTAFPLPPPKTMPDGGGGSNSLTVPVVGSSEAGSVPMSPPPSPGAIIDTMRSLGRGIYSGTFQGTLDPSLQDGHGRPRRSVSTILHILNDLLVAAPSSPLPTLPQSSQPATQPTRAAPTTPVAKAPNQVPATMLTPPPSPTEKSAIAAPTPPGPVMAFPATKIQELCSSQTTAAAPEANEESSDNALLRGKMQRLQMMLAQRKEQRRSRRELNAPYTCPVSASSAAAATRHVPQHSYCHLAGSQSKEEVEAAGGSTSVCREINSTASPTPTVESSGNSNLHQTHPNHHNHQQQQHQQQKLSTGTSTAAATTSCSSNQGGEPCAYCSPSREQDSLAAV